MIIRMFHQMSSGRHDGRVWPPAGVNFEVPDWEGEDLVAGGNAVEVTDGSAAQATEQPEAEAEAVPEDEAEDEAEDAPDGEPQAPGGPPKPAAPKQDWIDWAVSQGAEWITATNSTKQQLMEQYGQRP